MSKGSKGDLPHWIKDALQILRPPRQMTVSQWADKYRILPSTTSALPGPWRTDYTPYLRGIMDAFTDPDVEEIVFVKCTQVGGTEALLNMLGYVISQDPSPTMVVYPTDALGEWTADNRIQPMVDATPQLREAQMAGGKKMDMQFEGMFLAIASAQSPSSLSSRPCRFLFLDEVDKYPANSGKEANPRSLAKERTKTFESNRKIVEISSPTTEDGPIWQDWQTVDTQYKSFVPCIHCAEKRTLEFGHLKFDSSSPEAARQSAVYICPACGCAINDAEKNEMVRRGEWEPIGQARGRRRIGFHLNAFYSPWVRLGDIAYEFMVDKKVPELHQNFINSWLGEPYKQVESTLSAQKLWSNRQSQYKREEVPEGALMLTGGVDVQRKGMYWIVRAWMPNMTGYTITNGYAMSWKEVEYAMNKTYSDRKGQAYVVNFAGVDSGDQTEDVYDFCLRNREWAIPLKGSSKRLQSRYVLSTINKDGVTKGMPLCVLDTEYYKDGLYARFFRTAEEGGWYIYDGVDPEYADQLTAEHKVIENVRGRFVSHWVLKQSGRDNHYFDCEVYAACAADLCGMRSLAAENGRAEQEVAMPGLMSATGPPPSYMQSPGAGYLGKKSSGYFSGERRWRP